MKRARNVSFDEKGPNSGLMLLHEVVEQPNMGTYGSKTATVTVPKSASSRGSVTRG